MDVEVQNMLMDLLEEARVFIYLDDEESPEITKSKIRSLPKWEAKVSMLLDAYANR